MTPGDHVVDVAVGGRSRSFILHVPPQPAAASRPLILVFHGAEDSDASTAQGTDFEQVADANGEVVAFLQGFEDTWNEGAGHTPAEQAHVNDVAFTAAAIAKIESLVPFDHQRIVAAGFSNGALMVEDLGCRLAQEVSLIVPVEGELPASVSATCDPARPVSVYEIHATADGVIPYGGGPFHGVGGGTTVLSAPASAARWAALDGCAQTPTTSSPTSGIRLTDYGGCRGRVTVRLRTIEGGAHQWTSDIGQLVTQALGR
jgi:polyhydroxybutyrate depolymerase